MTLALRITMAPRTTSPISLNSRLALLESVVFPKCDCESMSCLRRRWSALFHRRRLRWHLVRIVRQVVHRMDRVTSRVNDPRGDKNDQVLFLGLVGLAPEQA